MGEHEISIDASKAIVPTLNTPNTDFDFEDIINRHTKEIEEMRSSLKDLAQEKEKVKTLQEKLEGHERNVIATMGILFSLFIGISSSLSLFSFARKTPLGQAIIIVVGVILTNITLAGVLVYMIKILFTHHKDEGATVKLIHRLFIRFIKYFIKPIANLVILLIILVVLLIIHANHHA